MSEHKTKSGYDLTAEQLWERATLIGKNDIERYEAVFEDGTEVTGEFELWPNKIEFSCGNGCCDEDFRTREEFLKSAFKRFKRIR